MAFDGTNEVFSLVDESQDRVEGLVVSMRGVKLDVTVLKISSQVLHDLRSNFLDIGILEEH